MKQRLLPFIVLVIISSCNYVGGERIRGNGNMKVENRTLSSFDAVNVSCNTDLYVKQDSIFSVRVEADENLMEYIITELDGNTLKIRSKDGVNLKSSSSIKVYVSGPSFNHFKASEASDIFSENKITSKEAIAIDISGASDVKMELMAPQIEANLSGASSLTLSGQTKDFKVDGSGSTDINCFDLQTENTVIKLSGSGNANVFASVKLDLRISGSADVRYKGNPTVSQKISGAGSVKKVD
ncbi:MAG: head GIN domain-containing protein [Chitinophagaceae bacterium]